MNNKKKNGTAKDFVKKHKVKLIVGGSIVASGVMFVVGFRSGAKSLANMIMKDIEVLDNPGDGLKSVWEPGFTIHGNLTVGDMGKLGEEYLKHDAELTIDTPVIEVGRMVFDCNKELVES